MNELIWLLHIMILTVSIILIGLWKEEILCDILPIILIAMNMFVAKLLPLFGQALPAGDSLAVAYALGLNIIAYKRGESASLKVLHRSGIMMFFMSFLCVWHIMIPALPNDTLSTAHDIVFMQTPWMYMASWLSFYSAQRIERALFTSLITSCSFTLCHSISSISAHIIDTLLFTLIGLHFHAIDSITIIGWSLLIKTLAWFISVLGVHFFYENNMAKRLSI